MDPVEHVSFRFEVTREGDFDELARERRATLNLILWRRDNDGRLYESETHQVGEHAYHPDEWRQTVGDIQRSLSEAEEQGRAWFGPKPFWRR